MFALDRNNYGKINSTFCSNCVLGLNPGDIQSQDLREEPLQYPNDKTFSGMIESVSVTVQKVDLQSYTHILS